MFFDLHAEVWGDQRVLAIKYARNEEEKLLAKLERDWGRMTENVPFDYSFFDEETTRLYQEERNLSGLITLFTGFSLFIAVIGLIGLLSFATEQRRKEIGIRKVLGASHMQIFSLINYPYLRLFFLAALLAVPLSWHSMREWLDAFAYRVEIDPSVYLLAGGLVIVFSALSVSYLSLRAASANPAEVLKDE